MGIKVDGRPSKDNHLIAQLLHQMAAIAMLARFKVTFITVQPFNSCTSRPDVCQCLVVQKPVDNMSKRYAKYINDPRSL